MMPIEIYAEILKSSCYQKVISKQLNFYNNQHFYDYCMSLPITKYELSNYLFTKPRTIVFFKKEFHLSYATIISTTIIILAACQKLVLILKIILLLAIKLAILYISLI